MFRGLEERAVDIVMAVWRDLDTINVRDQASCNASSRWLNPLPAAIGQQHENVGDERFTQSGRFGWRNRS